MRKIELTNVNKVFGDKMATTTALEDINFSANSGEVIAITGPSGSGKSTFMKILGGILSATSGDINIDGSDYGNMNKKQQSKFRLEHIGFILQAYNLLPYLKVSDQFKLADKVKKSRNIGTETFSKWARALKIDDLMNNYPDELSGGQQQRVAILRALYTNPDIILADEPTAALDGNMAVKSMQMLQDLAHRENKTVIIITHDARLLKYVDKNYRIVDGKGQFIDVNNAELV
ncbi:ABC transporter ATP-binding protein [Apilactobacillus kunkeei]|uniref:ABC transporter ATP-binding protein n=1 Tax=Apilactobacillus kunkeei TaxID=148814 RepID=UPI001126C75E|nr:ABC transporter ATP-binding protein [Apilactobacillus kunkeei]TPR52116.1 ABC transporter ATP-binding protein [Apilactobacillus kunkeei]CAI2661615.1 Bacitracin export ATP-binding protein BceA [Apilactobacillus kunkeei]CAI2665758.1 Bacitracin export ATP-binding protein BceA [Apilactobacillus kunkeei]CAI2666397.1 Bacitracin export ATP-binding protein BceA [Apilactobacillus kunkeei]CAI2666973.1 Bacitracin export ATP-binding protein BceA [Apilactobacillus kunkeei]